MEKKVALYANGFSLLVNKNAGETIITFLQQQPAYNPESGSLDLEGSTEVSTMVIPFSLAEQLVTVLHDCIEQQKNANDKKE